MTELPKAEISAVNLLQTVSTKVTLPAIWKSPEHSQEAFAVGSVVNIAAGGRLEVFKRISTKGVFLGIFRNFQNSSFSKDFLKNVWSDFFLFLKTPDSNPVKPVTPIKRLHYWCFRLFQNTHRKHLSNRLEKNYNIFQSVSIILWSFST